ncbi:MAG: hypothetical protein DHS20C11_07700 [Lysobacteraceae bacterium]|nr:MAG: hypothetical protein DHS20C11_07700 [Xanthomonadaceae bacterium]
MNSKKLLILAGALAVAAVAVMLLDKQSGPSISEKTALIPGLERDINNVAAISVETSDESIRVERTAEGWVVASRDNYPADLSKARELLVKLAEAKLLEAKTSKPENYAQLGVQSVDADDADNLAIALDGVDSGTIIIGKTATRGGPGTYVRRSDESQSWLASGRITPPKTALDWMQRDVINVASADLSRVEVRPVDGTAYTLIKPSKEAFNFEVEPIPEGRELSAPSAGNGVAGILASIRFDDVRGAVDGAVAAGSMVFYSHHGMQVQLDISTLDDSKWVAFSADYIAPEKAGDDDQNVEEVAADEPTEQDVKAEVDRINASLAGWYYQLPSYKAGNLLKPLEDLLAPLPEEQGEELED